MKSLHVLQRLAKQAVDRERQALLAIDAKIADVEARIEARRHSIERETSRSPDFMTSGATLPAFIATAKAEIERLSGQLIELQKAHGAQLERVRHERTEQKRYESLAQRRAKQAAMEAAAKEQKMIDELVTTRHRKS